MKKLDYENIKKDMEILDDIEKYNIRGYLELKKFYLDKEQFDKIDIIKSNSMHFRTYMTSRNRALKIKFNYSDYIDDIYNLNNE